MPQSLIITESKLKQHLDAQRRIVAGELSEDVSVVMDVDWQVRPLVVGILGSKCEIVPRNRGPNVRVAPFLFLNEGLWAWLGFREEWDGERPAGKVRRFSFRGIGLTVHFVYLHIRFKPQIFRAEWSGVARWNGSELGFQAGNAGHPHWQFDAVESLRDDDHETRATEILSTLRKESREQEVRQFFPQLAGRQQIRDLVELQKLSRIHFASAAAWWKKPPHDNHVYGPEKVGEIYVWLSGTLRYIRQELLRLT